MNPKISGSILSSSWSHVKVCLNKTLKPRSSAIMYVLLSNNKEFWIQLYEKEDRK